MRELGQGAARLCGRHGGAWLHIDPLGLSRKHPGLRIVRTLVILVHPTAILSFPLLLRGLCFPVTGSLGRPGKPAKGGFMTYVSSYLREVSQFPFCEAESGWDSFMLMMGP